MPTNRLLLLEKVARGLDDLLNKVVFIGGASMDLYVSPDAATENRPSGVIDCIIGSLALPDYARWEQLLLARGFEQQEAVGDCRNLWAYQGIRLNVLAREREALGYDYRWFDEGVFHAQSFSLPGGQQIKTFATPYFIAAKIESFLRRSGGDFRTSEDFEDLVFVLANREDISKELCGAFHEVRQYLQSHFQRFLRNPGLEEGLYWVLSRGVDEGEVQRIKSLMRQVADFNANFNWRQEYA
jgi:hypothetical protein